MVALDNEDSSSSDEECNILFIFIASCTCILAVYTNLTSCSFHLVEFLHNKRRCFGEGMGSWGDGSHLLFCIKFIALKSPSRFWTVIIFMHLCLSKLERLYCCCRMSRLEHLDVVVLLFCCKTMMLCVKNYVVLLLFENTEVSVLCYC